MFCLKIATFFPFVYIKILNLNSLNPSTHNNNIAIQRLTALWALTESGLGGILHAFKSPFTGLLIGSIAMIIITLICYHSDHIWKQLSQALVIVLIVKMLVSPHSMISAYFAVSFQAILAFILYTTIGINLISIGLLTTLGLVESALQKIVSLTVLFGFSIWEAIDALGKWIGKNLGYMIPFDSSTALIYTYVGLYFVAGLFLAYKLNGLVIKIANIKDVSKYQIVAASDQLTTKTKSKKRKNIWRFLTVMLLISSLIIIILYFSDNEYNNFGHAVYIFARTLIIIGIWYIFLAPLMTKWVKRFLSKKKNELSSQVNQVFELTPYMSYITKYAWKNSDGIKDFIFKCLMYCLHAKIPNEKT